MKKSNKGMSIVEVVVAVAVVLTVGVSFASGLSESLKLSQTALRTNQAAWLLEDGAEAIKTIRDTNWSNIQNLSINTNYYLTFDTSSNLWSITTTDPGSINGIFTRRFTLANVNRDANDDIAISGSNDDNTKYVNMYISWQVGNATITKNLDFYISNIFD